MISIKLELNPPLIVLSFMQSNPNAVLAGGAAQAALFGRPIEGDYDFYFDDEDNIMLAAVWLTTNGFKHRFSSAWADTYEKDSIVIQLITRKIYTPVLQKPAERFDEYRESRLRWPFKILEDFDIIGCKFAYWHMHGTVYTSEEAISDAAKKVVHLNRGKARGSLLHDPVSTARRLAKYRERGWKVPTSTWVELFETVAANPETVAEDYLVLYGSDSSGELE